MKKILFLFSLLFTSQAFGQTWNIGTPVKTDVTATLENGTLTISGTGAMGMTWATPQWYGYRLQITQVIIQEGVTNIPYDVFYNHNVLTSVEIPSSVTMLSSSAFGNCNELISINVASSNANYSSEDGVLFDKNKTTLIKYPEEKAGSYVIPNSVTNIDGWAFYNCKKLSSVEMPGSVTNIGGGAFKNCSSITSITIPESVKSIDVEAFANCNNLASISFPKSLERIGYSAFSATLWYNSQPDGLVYINKWLYEYKGTASDGTAVNIPEGTLEIVNRAFSEKSKLTSVIVPEGITRLGDNTFYMCSDLKSVVLPSTLQAIESSCFMYCSNLSIVISRNPEPPFANTKCTFCDIDPNAILFVPAGSKELYQDPNFGWQDFNIVELPEISTHITPTEDGATIEWLPYEYAEGYLLKIYADEERTDLIRTLEFDAEGQLVRELRAGDATAAFTHTLENLLSGTTYYYTFETLAANNVVLLSQSGEFTTLGEMTGIAGVKNISPAKITGYYSVLGVKLPEEPESGIYIVTYDDGKAEKKVKMKKN